jgi:tetratricopeptide (TPR) repeat protein
MPIALVVHRTRRIPLEESPGFGHAAERLRRAGEPQRAVALCRDGLRRFPDHVSARVTLGLALVDLGQHAEARAELRAVLKRAPDNLAAIRGLAHLHDHGEPEPELEPEPAPESVETTEVDADGAPGLQVSDGAPGLEVSDGAPGLQARGGDEPQAQPFEEAELEMAEIADPDERAYRAALPDFCLSLGPSLPSGDVRLDTAAGVDGGVLQEGSV